MYFMRFYSGYQKFCVFFQDSLSFPTEMDPSPFKSMAVVNRVVIFVIRFGYVGTPRLSMSPFCVRSRCTLVSRGFNCGLRIMLEDVNALIRIIIQEGHK
jgi:hypothetical protein